MPLTTPAGAARTRAGSDQSPEAETHNDLHRHGLVHQM